MRKALAIASLTLLGVTAAQAQVTIFPNAGNSPISNAIEVGPESVLTYFSGVVPAPADPTAARGTRAFYGDTYTQAISVFERIGENLRDKGLDFGDVVKMTAFLVGDPALGGQMDFANFNRAHREYFGTDDQPNRPVRSTVQVSGLVGPLMLVEIEVVTAHTPGQPTVTAESAAAGAAIPARTTAAMAEEPTHRYCLTCHGTDGQGNIGIDAPRLAGMERWYLKRQMENFRAGIRGTHPDDLPGQEMQPMAVMTDEQLEDILDWAETWEYVPAEITLTEGSADRGRLLYRSCATCHGQDGEGNQMMNAPALAGQNDWYMVTQLRNFRAGSRGYHNDDAYGRQMRAMMAPLGDERAINDVVAYINTLSR